MRSSSFLASRASRALFGAVGVGVVLVAAPGCRIEAHTQTQFEDSSQPAKTSTKDWDGEAITIQNDGINPLSGLGGVEVKISSTATKITAEATFAAQADDDKKSDADASIRDAIQTLVISETANGFDIRCGHGGAHGTSNVAASGCKILRVTIPAGTATKPLNLTVGNGNGSIRVGLANAGDVPFVNTLLVDNNGLGEVDIRARPVKGANLTITGEREVRVTLPSDFSAEKVTLTVDEDDATKAAARKITSDFPGMTGDNKPYPAAGATADAAASLNVQSKGPFDDDTVTIAKGTF
jgi:hypothetical protein